MRPLVSILITAYNAERWIRESVNSALDQTWPNIEVIVVDDGSGDRTGEMLRALSSRRLKVIEQENHGASSARNRALASAQGDFIQWLDADDVLDRSKIERQLLQNDPSPDTGTVYSGEWGRFYYRPGKARFERTPLWQDLQPLQWLLTSFTGGHMMHPASWLVSRKVTAMAGPWDERLSLNDDGEYFCRVVAASEQIQFCDGARSCYRTGHPGTLSWGLSSARWERSARSLLLSIDLCRDHLLALQNDEDSRRACISLYQGFIADIQPDGADVLAAAQARIRQLGGATHALPPRPWKMELLSSLIGGRRAKRLRLLVWRLESAVPRHVDHLLFRLERIGREPKSTVC